MHPTRIGSLPPHLHATVCSASTKPEHAQLGFPIARKAAAKHSRARRLLRLLHLWLCGCGAAAASASAAAAAGGGGGGGCGAAAAAPAAEPKAKAKKKKKK